MMESIWHVNILDGYKKTQRKPEKHSTAMFFYNFQKKISVFTIRKYNNYKDKEGELYDSTKRRCSERHVVMVNG